MSLSQRGSFYFKDQTSIFSGNILKHPNSAKEATAKMRDTGRRSECFRETIAHSRHCCLLKTGIKKEPILRE